MHHIQRLEQDSEQLAFFEKAFVTMCLTLQEYRIFAPIHAASPGARSCVAASVRYLLYIVSFIVRCMFSRMLLGSADAEQLLLAALSLDFSGFQLHGVSPSIFSLQFSFDKFRWINSQFPVFSWCFDFHGVFYSFSPRTAPQSRAREKKPVSIFMFSMRHLLVMFDEKFEIRDSQLGVFKVEHIREIRMDLYMS